MARLLGQPRPLPHIFRRLSAPEVNGRLAASQNSTHILSEFPIYTVYIKVCASLESLTFPSSPWGQSIPPLTALTKHGLQEGDIVYFLIPEGGRAPAELERSIKFLSEKIAIKEVRVPIDSFEAGVAKILGGLLEARA